MEMSELFEREVTLQKEIVEIDRQNEECAFQLFSKQLQFAKHKNNGLPCQQIESDIVELKKQIENLQLELDHQKQNQDNDQPYDTLDEVDQRGHHCQRKPKMFGSKISNHAKPQCHLQEDPNES